MQPNRLAALLVTLLVVIGTTGGLLAVVPEPTAASSWAIETVHEDAEGYAVANALSPDGNPQIVYFTDDGVTYARSDGRGWSHEVVASGRVSTRVGTLDLVVDRGGVPRVSYHDAEAGTLGYAYDAGTSWQAETVDAGNDGVVGQANSIAVESSGRPHIAYLGDGGAKHAASGRSSWRGGWINDDLNVRDEVNGGIAIDVASDGNPHVVYYVRSRTSVRYARWDGDTWFHETVASEGLVGNTLDIELGADDDAHIVYSEWKTGAGFDAGLHYAHWTGSTWERSTIDTDHGRWPSIALDADGNPHISYVVTHSSSDRELIYAYPTDDGWEVETVDRGQGIFDSSIAVADDGTVHISYVNYPLGSVKHATRLPVAVPVGICVTCGSGIGTWLAGDDDIMVTVEGDNDVDSFYFVSLDGGEVEEFEQVESPDTRDASLHVTTDARTAYEIATADDRLSAVQSAYTDDRIKVQPVGIGNSIKFGAVGFAVDVYTAGQNLIQGVTDLI